MITIPTKTIHEISFRVLCASGVPEGDAQLVADSIVFAHQRGKGTHGIVRLPIYVRKIREALMNPVTGKTVIQSGPVIKVIDAENGFGQVAAVYAMQHAVTSARELGVGVVGVRHSNNFGTAGFVAERAVTEGMIGIVLSNSAPAIAPTGGTRALLGTNPIAVAVPDGKQGLFMSLDMAVSQAARGKIRLALKNGEKIPFGWALDEKGEPTDDPAEALKGTMVPIGGAKGYGLALVVDILAGLLSGAGFGGGVRPLNHPSEVSNYGHFVMAFDAQAFLPVEQYADMLEELKARVKATGEEGQVYLPGECSRIKCVNGNLNLTKSVWETIESLCKQFEIDILAEEMNEA